MTRRRYDIESSTEFGLWIRGDKRGFREKTGREMETDVSSLSSRRSRAVFTKGCTSKGYVNYNLDYILLCYSTNDLMIIEEKRHNTNPSYNQLMVHSLIDAGMRFACENGCLFEIDGKMVELRYHGYHNITFQKTNPEDGWTKIDSEEVSIEQLLSFLRFETP